LELERKRESLCESLDATESVLERKASFMATGARGTNSTSNVAEVLCLLLVLVDGKTVKQPNSPFFTFGSSLMMERAEERVLGTGSALVDGCVPYHSIAGWERRGCTSH
jgi:hypothetical protein